MGVSCRYAKSQAGGHAEQQGSANSAEPAGPAASSELDLVLANVHAAWTCRSRSHDRASGRKQAIRGSELCLQGLHSHTVRWWSQLVALIALIAMAQEAYRKKERPARSSFRKDLRCVQRSLGSLKRPLKLFGDRIRVDGAVGILVDLRACAQPRRAEAKTQSRDGLCEVVT